MKRGRLLPAPLPDGEHSPIRTCVGCRQRDEQVDLLRVVAGSHAMDLNRVITVDLKRRAPGRGAYLHPRTSCLDQAERRHAVSRALRVPASVDLGLVRECVERIEQERAAFRDQQIVELEEG